MFLNKTHIKFVNDVPASDVSGLEI